MDEREPPPSTAASYVFKAGLLTEVHPIRTSSRREPVTYVQTVPFTALGTWRSFTAFPILPQRYHGHLEALSSSHERRSLRHPEFSARLVDAPSEWNASNPALARDPDPDRRSLR